MPCFSKIFQIFNRIADSESFHSRDYWERRYASGGTSGDGSYGRLAEFKAQVLNAFVRENNVTSVIEFGCGDGNQLGLAHYPNYIGLDVSPTAVTQCAVRFSDDLTKSFFLYDPFCFVDNAQVFQAELSLSLDVLFHLTEDDVYEKYMYHLFRAANRYVIIYSWGTATVSDTLSRHNRPREFEAFVDTHFPRWQLVDTIDNIFPYDPETEDGSLSNFYIYNLKDAL